MALGLGNALKFDIFAQDKTARAFNSVERRIGGLKVGFTALSAAAVAGVGFLTKNIANTGDEINKLSQKLSISAETLSSYRLAAELTDLSLEDLGKGLGKMAKNISDAANGLSTPRRALEDLGISAEKLKNLSINQQFEILAGAISKVENPADKVRIAMDLFGRAGQDLIPLLNQGAAGIAQFRNEAEKMGLVFSQAEAEDMERFNDSLTRLQLASQGFAKELLINVIPAISDFIEGMSAAIAMDNKGEKFFNTLGLSFVGIANALGLIDDEIAKSAVDEWWERVDDSTKKATDSTRKYKEITTGMADPIREASVALDELSEKTKELDRLAARIKEDVKTPFEKYKDDLAQLNEVYDSGRLSQEEYNRAIDMYGENLSKARESMEKLKEKTVDLEFSQRLLDDTLDGQIQSWQDLGRVAIKIIQDILHEQIRAAAFGGSGGGGLSGLFSGLFSAGAGFFSGGGASLFSSTGGIPPGGFASATGVPSAGFATGGSFTVGGSGGRDKTPISFMATRGEKVSIDTPGQQKTEGLVVNYNIDARGAAPGVEQNILAAIKQLDSGIERRAIKAVQNARIRNPAFLN